MRRVQRIACFPQPVRAPGTPEEARCGVTTSATSDSHTTTVRVANHAPHEFRFDRAWDMRGDLTSSDVLTMCPVSAASRTAFVVHGAEGGDAYAVFRALVAATLASLSVKEADGTPTPCSSSTSGSAAPSVDYSILRIYSWGATDVLQCEAVEDNMGTPRRTPLAVKGTARTPARRCRASLTSEADLRPLWGALERARLVPEWHSALCCTLSAPVDQGGFGDVTLLLLPGLPRANHLLRQDLLQLRLWLSTEATTHDHGAPAVPCRLRDFLLNSQNALSREEERHSVEQVYVITVLRRDTVRLEETALNAWFGSLPRSDTAASRAHFTALLGCASGVNTPHREPPPAAPPSTGSHSVSGVCERCAPALDEALLSATPRCHSGRAQHVHSALSPPLPASADVQAATRADVTVANGGMDLVAQLSATQHEIQALRLVKEGLENAIRELMNEFSEVLDEVDDSVAEMNTEVDRAEQALRMYQATTAAEQRAEMRRIERRLTSLPRASPQTSHPS